MKTVTRILAATLCFCVLWSATCALAAAKEAKAKETKTIEAIGTYIADSQLDETATGATARAREYAKRRIAEQAADYIEQNAKAIDPGLARDEIMALAEQFLKIDSEKSKAETVGGNAVKYAVRIKATVNGDNETSLREILTDKERLEEIVRRNATLHRAFDKLCEITDGLKGKYAAATLTERTRIKERAAVLGVNFAVTDALSKGNLFYARGEYEKSLAEYDRAMGINDKYAEVYNNRGLTYYRMYRLADAARDFERAVKIKPDFAEAQNNLGLIRYVTGNAAASIAYYNAALAINPKFSDALNNRGNAYAAIGKYDKAERDYLAAIEISPQSAHIHSNLANTYFSQNRMDEALGEYGKAVELNPNYAEAYYNRAAVYYTLGRYVDALPDAKKAAELKKNNRAAEDLRDKIEKKLNEYIG